MDGSALVRSAAGGHKAVVQMLLSWPHAPPRASAQGGLALVKACEGGHEPVVRLLVSHPLTLFLWLSLPLSPLSFPCVRATSPADVALPPPQLTWPLPATQLTRPLPPPQLTRPLCSCHLPS